MELVRYWRIIKRRWWLVAVLLAVVLAAYPLSASRPPASYSASMRFAVGLQPEPRSGAYYTYDYYYTWLTAEYLVDDLSEVVRSNVFAQDVATTSGVAVPPGAIQGATSAGKLHRILTVQITWGNADELERIANAVVQVMTERGDTYFAQLGTDSAVVSVIDPPSIGQVGASLRQTAGPAPAAHSGAAGRRGADLPARLSRRHRTRPRRSGPIVPAHSGRNPPAPATADHRPASFRPSTLTITSFVPILPVVV